VDMDQDLHGHAVSYFIRSSHRGQDEAAVLMNKPAMAGGMGSHWLCIAEIFTTCPDTNVSVGERETGCNCFGSRLSGLPASTGTDTEQST
jgi:hypothetical protein